MGGLDERGDGGHSGCLPRECMVRATYHRAGGAPARYAHRRIAPIRTFGRIGPAARRHGAGPRDCSWTSSEANRVRWSKRWSRSTSRVPSPSGCAVSESGACSVPRSPAHEVRDILLRLEMRVVETQTGWTVTPPLHRPDIELEVDLIEEVARIVGFANLPATLPIANLAINAHAENIVDLERVRGQLVDRGYHEAVTYSFVDAVLQARIAPALAGVVLANPIASDMSVMRTTLWPGLHRCSSPQRQSTAIPNPTVRNRTRVRCGAEARFVNRR